jgi:hypothetical protein
MANIIVYTAKLIYFDESFISLVKKMQSFNLQN